VFTRWRLPRLRLRTSNCSLLLIYLPRKDERLSWPGWLTYSGRFTHISGLQWKWSPISCRSSAGRGKFAGQKPTFYHCTTKPAKAWTPEARAIGPESKAFNHTTTEHVTALTERNQLSIDCLLLLRYSLIMNYIQFLNNSLLL